MLVDKSKSIDWTNWLNHELKTPLNRMEGLLISLDKKLSVGFEEKKLIMHLKSSLDECRDTIDSLYLFNKIQIDTIKPKLNYLDINSVVSQVVQDQNYLAERKGVKIIIESEPLFPVPIDEQLFKRAFSNLITNAIKFSKSESKILVSTESLEDKVYVQVSDQGTGIETSKLEKIFEPYYRIEETAHLPGTGLGLFIAKKFIEYQNAKISVDSEMGAGTTFTIEFKNDDSKKGSLEKNV